MQFLITVAVLIVSLASTLYLYRVYKKWRISQKVAKALDTDSLPEAGWAKTLAEARKTMPFEEYQKFEKSIYSIIDKINIANRSGLRTEKERLEMFLQLSGTQQDNQK